MENQINQFENFNSKGENCLKENNPNITKANNSMRKVELGNVFMSQKINLEIIQNPLFAVIVQGFLDRHLCGDWGDLEEEDIESNEFALCNNERLLSSYNLPNEVYTKTKENKVWIITEWDRSYTTVLFPSEY